MVIRGNIPNTIQARSAGVYYTRTLADGRRVLSKWPRKRPGALPDITQEQVARWDKAIYWARAPEPKAYALAMNETSGSAFYARDIILMETYGNYVSWPGWGRYPNGPAGGEVSYPVGTLKDVDAPKSVDAYRNNGTVTIFATLWEPSPVKLYFSTQEPQHAVSRVDRAGMSVPHGKKLWVPEALGEYDPTSGAGGQTPSWSVPDPDPSKGVIYWWIANKGSPAPIVEWSSAVYLLNQGPPPPHFGYWYLVMGFMEGPAGFTPDPTDAAAITAATMTTATCLTGQSQVTILQTSTKVLFAGCDFADFEGSFAPCPFPQCFNSAGKVSPTMPPAPTCNEPDPTSDIYFWWILFKYG